MNGNIYGNREVEGAEIVHVGHANILTKGNL